MVYQGRKHCAHDEQDVTPLLSALEAWPLTGLLDIAEARAYRDIHGLQGHRIVDLRDDRPQMRQRDLHDARRLKAERLFEDQDFDDLDVEGVDGWAFDGDNRFERTVFLDNGGEDSVAMVYAVAFAPGSADDFSVEFTLPERLDADKEGPSPT